MATVANPSLAEFAARIEDELVLAQVLIQRTGRGFALRHIANREAADTVLRVVKIGELRALAQWAEGMVWTSPERHGAMTGILKAQIDWIPLAIGSVRPTQGKTLAVMEVSGGSQSYNAVNQMRVLGRWMRMITIPNQSSVAKAFLEFDEAGRMKPSAYYERVVDVMEELVKFTLLTRDVAPYLVDRYSERRESAEELSKRVNQRAI